MGRKKKYTQREKKRAVQYLLKKKKKHNWVHEYCIDCAFHTPNPEGGQGRELCSVKQWDGGRQNKSTSRGPGTPQQALGGGGVGEKGGGGGGVGVLTFCRHSEKTGSSFQTPVQAIEWVSSVKESDTELSRVFFKYSIVRKSPHLLLSFLMLS